MVDSVSRHYPDQISRVNNLSSGVFNTANGLGEVIGPLFGARMYESYGFRMTSDVTALITFSYVLVFIFILTNGMSSIRHQLTNGATIYEEIEEQMEDGTGDKNDLKRKYVGSKKLDAVKEESLSQHSESLLSDDRSSFSSKRALSAAVKFHFSENIGLFKRNKDRKGDNADEERKEEAGETGFEADSEYQ